MHSIKFERRDLIQFEPLLRTELAKFLTFKSYSIHFPSADDQNYLVETYGLALDNPVYLAEERRLLLPLVYKEVLLGVFVATGVKIPYAKFTLPLIAKSAALILQNIFLHKVSITDSVTGLSSREHFLLLLEKEILLVQERIMPAEWESVSLAPENIQSPGRQSFAAGFSLILVKVLFLNNIRSKYGHLLSEEIEAKISEILKSVLSEEALAARLDRGVFGVIHASASSPNLLIATIMDAFSGFTYTCKSGGEILRLDFCASLASYPQDFYGAQFAVGAAEGARILLAKAERALVSAEQVFEKNETDPKIMPFANVLKEGGIVLQTLPHRRFLLSLGRDVSAYPGQRFFVWRPEKGGDAAFQDGFEKNRPSPAEIKTEVEIVEVEQNTSIAEIILPLPGFQNIESSLAESVVTSGDRLFLLESSSPEPGVPKEEKDAASGFFNRSAFLDHLAEAREGQARFAVALVQIMDSDTRSEDEDLPGLLQKANEKIAFLAEAVRETFGPDVLAGRFGFQSLAIFIPEQEPEQVRQSLQQILFTALSHSDDNLISDPADSNVRSWAAGIACYPFLHYGRADIMGNGCKALAHAFLLPGPEKVAVFDSVSLNISADRILEGGDRYAAIEEYKLALLADENNHLARISLGACLAEMGQLNVARAEFERVMDKEPENAMAIYNFGNVCLRLGELDRARKAFRSCLKLNPEDVFSLLRLGRMAEDAGRMADAGRYYNRAAVLPKGRGASMRHLARLEVKRGQPEAAREYLHQALLHYPKDAQCLYMMANIYLDGDEDPQVAEILARQAAALQPNKKDYWHVLAKALTAQGRTEEAREVLARAT